jgi:hypothetical protein
MKKPVVLIAILIIIITSACKQSIYLSQITWHIASVKRNVCKTLTNKVVLYAVFVDSKYSLPWTVYDIESTLDSIKIAKEWLIMQANESQIPLEIEVVNHVNNGVIPIAANFPRKTVKENIGKSYGQKSMIGWADKVARIAGKSLPIDTSGKIATKNTMNNKERLVARLRDIYQTDNVALIYFLNNYHKDEISVAMNTESDSDIEFAIVSYKESAVIAHEFLHLFGANDLYVNFYDIKNKKLTSRKESIAKLHPDEIMRSAYKNINKLSISPYTKYLIGWENELQSVYKDIMVGKKINLAKY